MPLKLGQPLPEISLKQKTDAGLVDVSLRRNVGKGKTVILDDRQKVSPGVKFGDAELIGVPNIVIVGKGLEQGNVDLWDRRSGERRGVGLDSALQEII